MRPDDRRRVRLALQLRQDEFGRLLGVDAATVSRWENGKALTSWQASVLEAMQLSLRLRPAIAVDVAGFLRADRIGYALGAALGPAAAATPIPEVPRGPPPRVRHPRDRLR